MLRSIALLAATLAAAMPAAAQYGPPSESCSVAAVPEGFVPLRDAPSAQGKVILEMKQDAQVVPRTDRARWRRGSFVLVSHRAPGVSVEEALKSGLLGWMTERQQSGCKLPQ